MEIELMAGVISVTGASICKKWSVVPASAMAKPASRLIMPIWNIVFAITSVCCMSGTHQVGFLVTVLVLDVVGGCLCDVVGDLVGTLGRG